MVAELATVSTRGFTRLFVSVSVPAKVANVPVVGSVTDVVLVAVNVMPKAPTVVNALAKVALPPKDSVYPPIVKELRLVMASTTLVPLQYNAIVLPLGTEIPAPDSVFNVKAYPPVTLLDRKYSLLTAGQITLRAAPGEPVATINIFRASFVPPSVLVRV